MTVRAKKENAVIEYPLRAVLFQYRDKPKEWHICSVENGAFGWGDTPEQAMRELERTLQGQIRETFTTGTDFFFSRPDDLWLKAFEEGKSPAEDVRLVTRLVGHLTIPLRGKPRGGSLRVEIVPSVTAPQPA